MEFLHSGHAFRHCVLYGDGSSILHTPTVANPPLSGKDKTISCSGVVGGNAEGSASGSARDRGNGIILCVRDSWHLFIVRI